MIEPATCLRCDSDIIGDVIANFFRCDDCLAELKARGSAFDQPHNLLVRATYSPGFATDLTGWSTEICSDGTLTQDINWYEKIHGKSRTTVQSSTVSEVELQSIATKLHAIDVDGISTLFRSITIDDAPFVHLFAPDAGIHFSVRIWNYRDHVPSKALQAVQCFFDAWKLIDSLSPLTIKQHGNSG